MLISVNYVAKGEHLYHPYDKEAFTNPLITKPSLFPKKQVQKQFT
jgi:hypothetical protein